jgi:hypothetical protein
VGNAVPPLLANKIAKIVYPVFVGIAARIMVNQDELETII